MKGWKDRFLFIDRRAISDPMAWRHHDYDVYDAFSDNDFSLQDVRSLSKRIIDLHPVPVGLLFACGLATTWDFLGFFSNFKDTGGNAVTMSEYLRFPFLSGVSIDKGAVIAPNNPIGQNTTPPLAADQPVSDKTDSQIEVEVEDPKVIAAREKKKAQMARAAAKKKDGRKRANDEGGSSKNRKDRTASPSPRGSATESVHHFVNVEERNQESPSQMETFVNMSDHPIHPPNDPVFTSKRNAGRNVDEAESSRSASVYVPKWNILMRCRVDTPAWCRELMTHVAPSAAQEESNALTNEVALERAWFSVAQGAMAQTDMLERFENLLANYDSLAETHVECSEIVRKLVDARLSLEHNAKLYMDAINRLRAVKEEHSLEAELAKKDSALTYTERLLAEGVKDREKLTVQLGQTKVEKFDCIRKLLPTVVRRLLSSHEYNKSLSEPFNMAIQAGWGRGLSEGHIDSEILDLVYKAKDFDIYSDRKLYPMYDKLFEAKYPYIEKIASRYRHSVAELLRV
ncbi:hypothetical protein Tco_1012565, partial [Tanacetum coccineum]